MAAELIALFRDLQGKTQGEVDDALRALEGESTNYRIRRGLAHLLHKNFSTFEIRSPMEPEGLRERVFATRPPWCPARTPPRRCWPAWPAN